LREYIKPNVILPLSLHDTRISDIVIENDTITFVFDDGIYIIEDKEAVRSGKATVSFYNVDFDFCRVSCIERNFYRKQMDIRDFAKKLAQDLVIIEIIDETYGYNQAKFSCIIITEEQWIDCHIDIYHFGPMKYLWEEGKE